MEEIKTKFTECIALLKKLEKDTEAASLPKFAVGNIIEYDGTDNSGAIVPPKGSIGRVSRISANMKNISVEFQEEKSSPNPYCCEVQNCALIFRNDQNMTLEEYFELFHKEEKVEFAVGDVVEYDGTPSALGGFRAPPKGSVGIVERIDNYIYVKFARDQCHPNPYCCLRKECTILVKKD